MKKLLLATGIALLSGLSSFGQNYISGVVSLHGDNTASGSTTVASGASLLFNKNKFYEQDKFINQGDSTAVSADTGMLVLNGTGAQTITGRFKLGGLQLSNSNGVTINKDEPVTMVTILDSINFGNINSAVLNAGDGLMTLRSNETKTARIADLTNKEANSNNKVSGNVIVERYIRSRRAWHLLAPPTTGDSINDQTIQAAWQEGARAPRGQVVDPNPGYGTVITRPGNDPSSATGYDDGVVGTTGYSMRLYLSNGLYATASNTDLTHFSPHAAYFLFIRGDRSVSPASQASSTTPSTITTLRSKGSLHNGDVIDTVTKTGGDFGGVANPYACAVDFSQLATNGLMNGFYTWDPSINKYGGWVYIDGDDNYNATPAVPGGVYTNSATNPFIQSGQAILVKPIGSMGTITFKEKNKNISNRVDAFRMVAAPALTVTLLGKDNSLAFLDGTTTIFDESFSHDALPDEDITKPNNLNENLSFYASGQYLLKGKNPLPVAGDTLPLRLWKTTARQYSFAISLKNMQPASQAYLLDNYTKSSTPIQSNGGIDYDFSVTSDEGSKAIDRFAIVFGAGALPVTLTSIDAEWNGTQVNVQWNVKNETGIRSYEVEKSTNGVAFVKIGEVSARNSPAASDAYHFADNQPADGDNFYRIKIINQNGSYAYTSIAVAVVPAGKASITIFPNPVKNGLVKFWFKNVKAGSYALELYSMDGKLVLSKIVSHPGGAFTYTLPAGTLAQGMYHAVIKTKEGNAFTDLSVMID